MKKAAIIFSALLLCTQINAQDGVYGSGTADTANVQPIESARLQGARKATEAEKEYARALAHEREEQNQIDNNLPPVDNNGQVITENDYYYPTWNGLYGWDSWALHKGLNVNLGASAFFQSGRGARHGAGFTQDASLMYVTNLGKKGTLAVGGYFNNLTWGGDNYTTAGISALLGYRFDEHWSAYAFVQKAMTSNNMFPTAYYGYPYYGGYYGYGYMGALGADYGPRANRFMDRIGGGVRYDFNDHSYIQINVEYDRLPSQRMPGYDYHRYDYPVR